MRKVAVVMACYNRRDYTLRCIDALSRSFRDGFELAIFLLDDLSVDGTGDAVRTNYPDVVVIRGSGSMYWNGGMRIAWIEALKSGADGFLWINDDTTIKPNSIVNLVNSYVDLRSKTNKVGAVVGTIVDPISKKPTYGGRARKSLFNPLSFGDVLFSENDFIQCDFINGNFTLIPIEAVCEIGILSSRYTHSMGDFDYGLRLKKTGYQCWVAPGVHGECSSNSFEGGARDSTLSVRERVAKMRSITQCPPVKEWSFFVREHGGWVWPFLYLKAYMRAWFPWLWVALRGK